jgi:hypothetical protein
MASKKNEKTSRTIGSIAARALKNPGDATNAEIRKLAGSALTQVPDKPKRKK